MNYEECPRCHENKVTTTITPDRSYKPKESNKHDVGDERYHECLFCHWWSRATWNGHKWQWSRIGKLRPKDRVALDLRLQRLKKKRRAFGGKGR